MNVTSSFRSSKKNPSSAAAGQSHEALIFFWTLWWLFLSSRNIWVIRTNSCIAHGAMLMIIFVSFPNRPVSLTPSISPQVPWNSWYQKFFSASKGKCGCFVWQLSHNIRIYTFLNLSAGVTYHFSQSKAVCFCLVGFFWVFKCQHSLFWEKHIFLMQYFIACISQVCQRSQVSSAPTVLYLNKSK